MNGLKLKFSKGLEEGFVCQKTSVGGVWTFSGTIYRFSGLNIYVNKLSCTC